MLLFRNPAKINLNCAGINEIGNTVALPAGLASRIRIKPETV